MRQQRESGRSISDKIWRPLLMITEVTIRNRYQEQIEAMGIPS